jgi:hypothetical protein
MKTAKIIYDKFKKGLVHVSSSTDDSPKRLPIASPVGSARYSNGKHEETKEGGCCS